MKTFTCLFLMMAGFVMTGHAKIWIVDSNPGNTGKDFSALSTAVADAAVLNGDTIYVVGSSINYSGSFTLSKRLYIFGPGYFLSQNQNTQANTASANMTSTLTFGTGSEGSIVQGMTFTSNIHFNSNVTNITLRRNNLSSCYISMGTGNGNIIIVQNYIVYNSCCTYTITVGGSATNIIISNNYIEQQSGSSAGAVSAPTGSTVYLTNNIITSSGGFAANLNSATGSFDNNIVRNGSITATTIVERNNLSNAVQLDTTNGNPFGNLVNVNMANVFKMTGTTDEQWQLIPSTSPALGAGLSGEDCGMYGGNSPYVLSGLPPIPSIYFMSAPVSGSATQGLPVTIKVKSRN